MSASPYVIDVTSESFAADVLENSRHVPVLVDFWAAWCGPCQMLMPLLEKLADEYTGQFILAKVNIDEQQQLALEFNVRSVPTVKLFRHGHAVEEFLGVRPETEIRALIEGYVERESDRLIATAQATFEQGRTAEALRTMEDVLVKEPGNYKARIALAQMLLLEGRYQDAEGWLGDLPADIRAGESVSVLLARLEFGRIAQQAPRQEALEGALKANPANSEARYQLAAHRAVAGDYESAMELLLELLRRDRSYGGDVARKGLVRIFEILGGKGDLVTRYRAKMFNALH